MIEQTNKLPEKVKYDLTFAREIYSLENGAYIKQCMQCGMCAVSCSTCDIMDYSPRKLFNLIKLGKKDEVMQANTFWYCTSCCTCKARCPRGIPLVDVMHDLKKYALDNGYCNYPQAAFYKAFWAEVASRGRSFESGITARYFLIQGLDEVIKYMDMKDVGIDMLKHNRLPFLPPKKVKDLGNLKKIIRKAQELAQREARS
ncbi:4Fe-4S dicluster domain-containing protein [Desulfoscipio gibsoniae]|uniref:Heterodisulfide reductase, subunit C n=1 Tax=Desulfoscipio gibsoniae DSM 7213 TaxID=767817 RepID=R4KR42_9FIRM|nr:4Fe-4S dicluster domain-containing protein [Desulfoscipio gibsoniae]AGL03020.1 heterodisulfide reductase, subunit C [Desulfoscipio gibsoniae DSM 7213]